MSRSRRARRSSDTGMRKFARKHKAAISVVGVFCLLLLLSAAVSLLLMTQARRARAEAMQSS